MSNNELVKKFLEQFTQNNIKVTVPPFIRSCGACVQEPPREEKSQPSDIEDNDSEIQSFVDPAEDNDITERDLGYFDRTKRLKSIGDRFAQISKICSEVTQLAQLEPDQISVFAEYIDLARIVDINRYQSEDIKGLVLTTRLVGLKVSEEKQFFMGLREILNKMLGEATIRQQIMQLCAKSSLDIDRKRQIIIQQIIQKGCVEKKFLPVYFQILRDACHGLLSQNLQSNPRYILDELESQFQSLIIFDDFQTYNEGMVGQKELQVLYKGQLCELIGMFSQVSVDFRNLARSKLRLLLNEEALKFAFSMAKYMPADDLQELHVYYSELQRQERTSQLLDFKYEQVCQKQLLEPTLESSQSTSEFISIQDDAKEYGTELVEQIISDLNECDLHSAISQRTGVHITEKALEKPQIRRLIVAITLYGIEENNADSTREQLARCLFKARASADEQRAFYEYIASCLLQPHITDLADPSKLQAMVQFLANLIYQQKIGLPKFICLINDAVQTRFGTNQDYAVPVLREVFSVMFQQFVLCSVRSQLSDQEGEFPEFLTKIMQYVLRQSDLRPIQQLNANSEYLAFARQDRFGYFAFPDCPTARVPNHIEAEYIQNVSAVIQSQAEALSQLSDLLKSPGQTQAAFFIDFFQTCNAPPLLAAVGKFIQGIDIFRIPDECRMEQFALRQIQITQSLPPKSFHFCAQMLLDTLLEMKSNLENAFKLFKKIQKNITPSELVKALSRTKNIDWMQNPEFSLWLASIAPQ